jgi:hypothetical protein
MPCRTRNVCKTPCHAARWHREPAVRRLREGTQRCTQVLHNLEGTERGIGRCRAPDAQSLQKSTTTPISSARNPAYPGALSCGALGACTARRPRQDDIHGQFRQPGKQAPSRSVTLRPPRPPRLRKPDARQAPADRAPAPPACPLARGLGFRSTRPSRTRAARSPVPPRPPAARSRPQRSAPPCGGSGKPWQNSLAQLAEIRGAVVRYKLVCTARDPLVPGWLQRQKPPFDSCCKRL